MNSKEELKRIIKSHHIALDQLDKLAQVIAFIKENLHIEFYHIKHSRYYTIQLGNTLINVPKETYYELQEVLKSE